MKMLRKFLLAALTSLLVLSSSSALAAEEPQRPGVYIVPGSKINLVSTESRFPIQVRNDYDTDVRVFVWVHPTVLWLTTPEAVEVTVPANTTVNAKVPITALSNGKAVVEVRLTSFSGVPLGGTIYKYFTVQPGVEPVILGGFILTIGALGWVGTRRMLRRSRGERS
jgi:hypothetical protein